MRTHSKVLCHALRPVLIIPQQYLFGSVMKLDKRKKIEHLHGKWLPSCRWQPIYPFTLLNIIAIDVTSVSIARKPIIAAWRAPQLDMQQNRNGEWIVQANEELQTMASLVTERISILERTHLYCFTYLSMAQHVADCCEICNLVFSMPL